jgi:nucleoside phosphorylase
MNQIRHHLTEAHLRRTYDTSPAPLLVIAPTAREFGGLQAKRLSGVGVAEVGIGRESGMNLRRVLETRPPSVVLSLGFAGALSEGPKTGDLVVSTGISTIHLPSRQASLDRRYALEARQALADAGLYALEGNLLTASAPLLAAEDKERHGSHSGAIVVDLEGYWLAVEAERVGVPMVCLRVVLDEMNHSLPTMVADITADGGRHEWWHTLRAMRNPANAGALLPLAVRSRRAIGSLRLAARSLVPVLTKDARLRAVYR